ncbi:hypothetical protein OUZ56_005496 [Daphnia magna]|uniref:Uncharacterized protein n=1 Tax=Daphnia magna TaxID=35525 RepID=A0ABQ9YSY9_9CRUS|nr:hypothetical protein OUZ56_005496 [Daphnia magna]
MQAYYRAEREALLSGFVGDLLRKIREKEVNENAPLTAPIPDALKYVVPHHTPNIRCFLPEHLESRLPGTLLCPIVHILGSTTCASRETIIYSSAALEAPTRSFCLRTTEVDVDPHLERWKTCWLLRGRLWTGGPTLTYDAALTGRIVGGKGLLFMFTF